MDYHSPVLLNESIEGLNINPSGVYVDATFGGGYHSKEILSRLDKKGRLFRALIRKSVLLLAGWLAGRVAGPGSLGWEIHIFPSKYLDSLWESKENSTPAREAHRREIKVLPSKHLDFH